MRSWVFLIFFILLSLSNSHALELFGYKLYDGIDQYINDGEVNFKKNKVAPALNFYREVMIENKNLYHHVGIYSYTPDSINTFINLPKSKNEIDLSLEQMRAMDSNIPIGVTYVPEVPISVDTKEDLINIETNIRVHNDKS